MTVLAHQLRCISRSTPPPLPVSSLCSARATTDSWATFHLLACASRRSPPTLARRRHTYEISSPPPFLTTLPPAPRKEKSRAARHIPGSSAVHRRKPKQPCRPFRRVARDGSTPMLCESLRACQAVGSFKRPTRAAQDLNPAMVPIRTFLRSLPSYRVTASWGRRARVPSRRSLSDMTSTFRPSSPSSSPTIAACS